jgi:hypothetical protein
MGSAIRVFDGSATMDALLAELDAEGAAGILDAVGAGLIGRINADLEPYVERERRRLADDARKPAVRVGALLAKSPGIAPLLQSPLVHGICERFLLPHCSCYRLSSIHLIEVSPHSPAGHVHRDDVIWPIPGPRPTAVINFLIPLTDFTPENGATCVVPGSHRWPRNADKVGPGRLDLDVVAQIDPGELVSTSLGAGSILAVLGGVLHCSGANTTASPRRALSVSVNLGWLRQEENLYLSVPHEIVAGLPEDVQQFIGYQIHAPYLGHTGFE